MYTYTLQYHQSIKEETENPYKHTVRERVSKNKSKMRLEKEKRQRRSAKQLKQRYRSLQLQYVNLIPREEVIVLLTAELPETTLFVSVAEPPVM